MTEQISTFSLQIGLSREEIFEYFREDLSRELGSIRSWESVLADRKVWLGRWCSKKKIDAEVVAVVLDWHEGFDWDEWQANGFPEKTTETSLPHHKAIERLASQRAEPGTLWTLLCFGYQHQKYFKGLKNNPKWLIAPGNPSTAVCTEHGPAFIGGWAESKYPRILGIRLP